MTPVRRRTRRRLHRAVDGSPPVGCRRAARGNARPCGQHARLREPFNEARAKRVQADIDATGVTIALKGSIAFTRYIDEAAAAMYSLQNEVWPPRPSRCRGSAARPTARSQTEPRLEGGPGSYRDRSSLAGPWECTRRSGYASRRAQPEGAAGVERLKHENAKRYAIRAEGKRSGSRIAEKATFGSRLENRSTEAYEGAVDVILGPAE